VAETHVFFFFNGWVSTSIGLGVCAIGRKYGRRRGCVSVWMRGEEGRKEKRERERERERGKERKEIRWGTRGAAWVVGQRWGNLLLTIPVMTRGKENLLLILKPQLLLIKSGPHFIKIISFNN
jgi:hypothetical protein